MLQPRAVAEGNQRGCPSIWERESMAETTRETPKQAAARVVREAQPLLQRELDTRYGASRYRVMVLRGQLHIVKVSSGTLD